MKKSLRNLFGIFLPLLVCVAGGLGIIESEKTFANSSDCEILEEQDGRLLNDYLDFYGIGRENFSVSNNGGELSGNELTKAFDRNFNTTFKSAQDNNVDYIDNNGVTQKNYINQIDIAFNQTVKIDRIMYGSENKSITRGYPTILNIYESQTGENFNLVKQFKTTPTSKMVIFDLGEVIQTKYIRFEYEKVETAHKFVATAREIIFLQEENDYYSEYRNLFSSYNKVTLNKNYNTLDKINELKANLTANLSIVSADVDKNFERAKKVLSGEISQDENREFSTDPQSKNILNRYGNIASYSRNTLKLSKFGTNRQVSGIYAMAGEEITIYVTANENDSLPQIVFSQQMGSWRSWKSGEYSLNLGENTFTVPSFKFSDYVVDVPLGGSIYICNPYTLAQQSSNVKIYIEGGSLYPVFKQGVNEEEYKSQLSSFASLVEQDPENVVDITEIVTDHAILTVNATKANELYANYSPQSALTQWNEYFDKLLNFGGVYQDKSNPLFDIRNLYVNVNIRIVQPWDGGWMFAAGEHIGVQASSQNTLIYGSGFGWGITHEIGHMLDIDERTVSECSNNMWAKFNETAIEKTATRGDFDKTLEALCNPADDSDSYFNSNRYNFLVWWYIEAYHNGYWGELENCYRGLNKTLREFLAIDSSYAQTIKSLTSTEKQILYSSLVVGFDLSYYFQRWGFTIKESDGAFKMQTASPEFKFLLNEGYKYDFIDNTKQPKLWLQDSKQYNLLQEFEGPLYNGKNAISITKVLRGFTGFTVLLDDVEDERHLGYEIYRTNQDGEWEIIGFTQSNVFYDEGSFSYTPKYKVRGYDRFFNTTSLSKAKYNSTKLQNVCRIGDVKYTSLMEAISQANEGDEIVLFLSLESGALNINKNITIRLEDNAKKSIIIYRATRGDFITVASGKTLTLRGSSRANIVIDGSSFKQAGSLLAVSGVLDARYVTFQNNYTTSSGGGGIRMLTANRNTPSLIKDCVFQNNSAPNGGGIFSDNPANVLKLENVKFLSNKADSNGSGILNKGTITLDKCTFKKNVAGGNGSFYNYSGGVANVNNCTFSQNQANCGGGLWIDGTTVIKGGEISYNTATMGGGVYNIAGNLKRTLTILNATFLDNNAESGSELYFAGATLQLTNVNIAGQSIYLQSGTCNIDHDCNISTEIILADANLTLNKGFFANISSCLFNVIDANENKVVFLASNFTLDKNKVSTLQVKGDHLKIVVSGNNGVIAFQPLIVTFLDKNGNVLDSKTVWFGDSITLFKIDDEKFLGWHDGKQLITSEQLVVTKNLVLTANYKKDRSLVKSLAIVGGSAGGGTIFLISCIAYSRRKKIERLNMMDA